MLCFFRAEGSLQVVVSLLLRLPSSRAKLTTELAQTRRQLELKLVPLAESLPEGVSYQATLPLEGKSKDWLIDQMERLQKMEKNDVKEGRVSGAVYHVSSLDRVASYSSLFCGREVMRSTR